MLRGHRCEMAGGASTSPGRFRHTGPKTDLAGGVFDDGAGQRDYRVGLATTGLAFLPRGLSQLKCCDAEDVVILKIWFAMGVHAGGLENWLHLVSPGKFGGFGIQPGDIQKHVGATGM